MAFLPVHISGIPAVRAVKNRLQKIGGKARSIQQPLFVLGQFMQAFFQLGQGVGITIKHLLALGNGEGCHGFVQLLIPAYMGIDIMNPFVTQMAVFGLSLLIQPHNGIVLGIG